MYSHLYSQFLKKNKNKAHYACHSHHYWPDCTREAMLQYWEDSATYVDKKWEYFLSEKIPRTQKLIAKILRLSDPGQIVFAPNTHELVFRLLSCLNLCKPLRILTTDSEFHSFTRQLQRLSEYQSVKIDFVSALPVETFETRFIQQIGSEKYDFIFFSHVFYNSGQVVIKLSEIVNSVENDKTIICVDGYHGFCAVPTDLSKIQNRIFYVAGSYKYAGAGEGCAFMQIPSNSELRPLNTGWFAGLNSLEQSTDKSVQYPNNSMRFAGATMDFSALYRLLSVLDLFESEGITIEIIHDIVQKKQKKFLKHLEATKPEWLEKLIFSNWERQGHFLTFDFQTEEMALKINNELDRIGVITDFRGSRLRFGFSIYHQQEISF